MKLATTNTTTTLVIAGVDGVAPYESFIKYKPIFFCLPISSTGWSGSVSYRVGFDCILLKQNMLKVDIVLWLKQPYTTTTMITATRRHLLIFHH